MQISHSDSISKGGNCDDETVHVIGKIFRRRYLGKRAVLELDVHLVGDLLYLGIETLDCPVQRQGVIDMPAVADKDFFTVHLEVEVEIVPIGTIERKRDSGIPADFRGEDDGFANLLLLKTYINVYKSVFYAHFNQ